jgi:2-amino-4-hydroxy-6-hydroxymethyldihydropteridine diphosphokinase
LNAWQPAYIAVGSNLNDPRAQVLRAQEKLGALPTTRVVLRSSLYQTRPFGPIPQPDFVNAVVGMLTQLDAPALLKELQQLEIALGRPTVHEKWGPRVIDLDLLMHGREQRNEPNLTLPHPGIVERNFVLYPLADIAPDLDVPGLGQVAELKRRVSPEGIRPL